MKKLLTISLFSIGCSDIKSSALNTSGIHADISAIAEDGKTEVKVILKAGDENSITFVELDEEDKLEARDGTEAFELGHSFVFNMHTYSADFVETAPGTEFTISLVRELEDDAPSSLATLTEDVTLLMDDGTVHSRQDPLTISWEAVEPGDDTLYLKVAGDCIFSIEQEVSLSDGSYTIDSSDFESSNSEAEEQSCEITVVIERRKKGTIDPAYGSGNIYGGVRKQQSLRLDL